MEVRYQVGLGVRVDPELREQVDRVAKECLLSRSELVRGWLVDGIKAHTLKSKRIAAMTAYKGEPDL
jgi:metal-responsive CopG/Arc/MetJ family transcriptional regulator